MRIYLAADHNGYELKNKLRDWLVRDGYEVSDMGPDDYDKDDDYPDFALKLGRAVADDNDGFGIAICGSGVGMAVGANKIKGIRAGLIHDPMIAEAARRDDDINVLALGASYISFENAKEVAGAWLKAKFTQADRHIRRIGKITAYERSRRCKCE